MKKIKPLLFIAVVLFIPAGVAGQVSFWTENFNNGCSSNCPADGYSGVNGVWTVANTGTNGTVANEFFVSCAENGQPVNACGTGCGNNATLHVGSVPCTLCIICLNGDCGAAYNAGPPFLGEDPLTDKRAESPLISTLGKTGITLSFKYMENGQGAVDDASVEYSINGGASWSVLTNPAKTPNICPGGQGLWTAFSFSLPASCDNINNLKIGFRWINDSNTGSDPSFAVDDVDLSSASALPPQADFSTALTTFCDSTCIPFNDLSQNSPSTWNWLFPGATPSSFSGQSPVNICYNVPGTYDVTLIVSNAAGTDTMVKSNYITVNSCFLPQVAFSASDTFFCEKNCIDFTDLTGNNPVSWQWFFTGASPDTSTLQNPTNICYNAYGTYPVKLVATNIIGSDSAVYNSYITVNQNPAVPVATLSGGNILTSTPAYSYQWYYNTVLIPGAVFQVYIAGATGDYFVIVTDSNGCQAASASVYVGFQDIGDPSGIADMTVQPNPVNDIIELQCFALKKMNAGVAIYDLSGRVLIRQDLLIMPGQQRFRLNVAGLESGIYLIGVGNQSASVIKKIIKIN